MNKPSENKQKDFTRVLRGYAPNEVEEYISLQRKEADEMRAYIAELENRISYLSKQNNILKHTNATPKYILDEARALGEQIISNANEEAAIIIASAKTSCDNLMNEFRFRMGQEKEKLIALQNTVQEFKTNLYSAYQKHIDDVESITDTADIEALKMDSEEYSEKVVADIKTEVAYLTAELKQKRENESENKIDDEYFANREAELEAELANEQRNFGETTVFNPDIDLSDLPEDGALNEDNSSDNISNITENEFIEENEEGAAEKPASVGEYMQETEDDMIAVGDEDNSVPVYEDISAQSDRKESAENEEIPLYDEAKIARASGESKEETANGVLFPDDKIPDLIYSSEKSGKKPKKHKKSDAMASYDDILENFARELGEEKENASEADNS